MENAKLIWKDSVTYCSDEYEAVTGVDGMLILTEWNQFRNLNLEKIKSFMKGNAFFDFRNIYKPDEVEAQGFVYVGVGQGEVFSGGYP